ncbi:hypothetical protein [Streptomyces sp. NPDC048639]|uniref:hypothetical protein n=1 Tax=Streptomyces sp. NPDC048639 TaxID=3365581 RepID=UPI003715F09E
MSRERKDARQKLAGLDLPKGYRLKDIVNAVARERSRDIVIHPLKLDGEISGLCVVGDHRDFIFVDNTASPFFRTHITLHELAHLLEGDGVTSGTCVSVNRSALSIRRTQAPLSALPKSLVEEVRGRPVKLRADYTSLEERRAEIFATCALMSLPRPEVETLAPIYSAFGGKGTRL